MTTNAPALILPDAPEDSAAPSSLHDIRPPLDIFSLWDYVMWLLVGLILVALIYGLWTYWLKRKRTRQQLQETASRIPPNEKARQRLDAALDHLHDPRFFCTLVSDAIRSYLEEQFELRAPERTTEEFLDELKHSTRLDLAQKQMLDQFLTQCDMAKFARADMMGKELETLHAMGIKFVQDTDYGLMATEGLGHQGPDHATNKLDHSGQ
jgi:hypothetical protein